MRAYGQTKLSILVTRNMPVLIIRFKDHLVLSCYKRASRFSKRLFWLCASKMFWRRKNRRLKARLDTVVEASEQIRRSYRPKAPRVKIDTSFVEPPVETEVDEELPSLELVSTSEDDRNPELEEHEATNDNKLEFEPRPTRSPFPVITKK